jgi:integrase
LGELLAVGGPYELQLKERGVVNIQRSLSSLRRGLRAHMGGDVGLMSRNDIVTAIGEITKRGKPGAAHDLRKHSRTFLEWAVSHLAKFNVMAGLGAPVKTRAQRLLDAEAKGEALSDAELVKVWRAAQELQGAARGEPVSGAFGAIAQMALLTAMRRGELAQLRHEHILTGTRGTDHNGITGERIHLPGSITKTAADHDVPLTALMRAVITAQPRGTISLPLRITGGVVGDWTRAVDAPRETSGVNFKMQALRRTVRPDWAWPRTMPSWQSVIKGRP